MTASWIKETLERTATEDDLEEQQQVTETEIGLEYELANVK